jgi:DNA-binding PadR family transcriptional regulator
MIEDINNPCGTRLGPGILYGTIVRLEQQGWIEPLPVQDRRQPYRTTAQGQQVLRAKMTTLHQFTKAGLKRIWQICGRSRRRFSGYRGDTISMQSFAVDELERLNASGPSGRFFGRLDMQRIGVFGYSLGGATALQFCHDDSRCKASIDVDGAPLGSVIREDLSLPVLFLMEDMNAASDEEGRQVETNIRPQICQPT